jgi:hypothetical protein
MAAQPVDINSILQALASSAGSAQQNAQTYGDMLRQRREFLQSAENTSADAAQQAVLNGGQGGVRISSQDATQPLIDFHTNNANKNAELTQQMFGYQGQANDLLGKLSDIATQQAGQGVTLRGQNLQYYGQPTDPTAPGTSSSSGAGSVMSNPILDLHANNIWHGQETLDKVPPELQPRVAALLQQQGYDPAKTVKDLVGQAEAEYLGNNKGDTGNPLAASNDPFRAGAATIGDLLDRATGGKWQTGYEKQKNSYENLRQNFKSELSRISGFSNKASPKVLDQLANSLPSENDTPDQAAKKFASVRNQINDVFYNGGQPGTSSGNTGTTMKVGKYTVQY